MEQASPTGACSIIYTEVSMPFIVPQSFTDTQAFRNMQVAVGRLTTRPVFVLPSTPSVLERVRPITADEHSCVVVGSALVGGMKPVDLLRRLKETDEHPPIVVFTDQILDQADTSLLVRTDRGDRYLSPLEAVLNASYGYDIVVWTASGFETVPAGSDDLAGLAKHLLTHLDDAQRLGPDWQAGPLQMHRLPETRRYNAKRKIRFFRSAIINAFRDVPRAAEAIELLAKADELDRMVDQETAA